MHEGSKLRTDPYRYVLKNTRPGSIDLQLHALFILHTKPLCSLRGQMDVPFCGNDPLPQLYPAPGTLQHGTRAACNLPAEPHRGIHAQRPGIGQGNFHLGILSFRAEDCHIFQSPLWPQHRDPLIGKVLSRLG